MKLNDDILNIRVATPCHANWDQMEGDERARFCGRCRKHVYNLSALSAEAAADLVREKEGKLCVRFYLRTDGTMLHGEDCPVGLAARQWQHVKKLASAAASLVLLMLGAGNARAGEPVGTNTAREIKGDAVVGTPEPVMGLVALPTPSPSPTPAATPVPTATPKPTATP